MLEKNRELRCSMTAFAICGAVMTGIGFLVSAVTGILVLTVWLTALTVFLLIERHRYQKLQKLSTDLEALLASGTVLPIADYQEGELSILASQIQKITLRLQETTEALKADKRYLADSLADISHQLRTPLTAMNLAASMLRNPELSAEKRIELSGELRGLLVRTDWLVETLLKISKLDAGTICLSQIQVPVKAVIDRAAEPLAVSMDLRRQRLNVSVGEACFVGDCVWTAEAVGNILKNCSEHTPEGGSITVTASENALYTKIEIRDSGPGFDPKDIPHLFERFYRGSNASENSYGIGLALARTVITAQNGTIQALNTPTGACFVIKFYKQVI